MKGKLEQKVCNDTMSEFLYQYMLSFNLHGEYYQGCASNAVPLNIIDRSEDACFRSVENAIYGSKRFEQSIQEYQNIVAKNNEKADPDENDLIGYKISIEQEDETGIEFALVEEYPSREVTIERFMVEKTKGAVNVYNPVEDSRDTQLALSPDLEEAIKSNCELR